MHPEACHGQVSSADEEYYRLRTEWLRYRSQLHDGLTGLPAFASVLEDVRRLLEVNGGLEVVYLDMGRSGWHETKLGWAAYDEAILEFAHRMQALRAGGEIEQHDVLCLFTVRSDRFLLFRAAPAGSASDPAEYPARLLLALRAGGAASSGPEALRVAVGHARVLQDPMTRAERAIQQAVADAMLMSLREREGIDSARRDELQRLIASAGVRSVFHPIVRLADGSVVGHEALSRPIGARVFESVEELFAFAESTELLLEFERLCRSTAIRAAEKLGGRGLLFLNASARAIEDPEWSSGAVDALLARHGIRPEGVVVEITERVAVTQQLAFSAALRSFKERGYRVAVDDMGAGYASLQSLLAIEPDFLKFDVSLVRAIDKSSIKRSLLESLLSLADKIHARVIAEGVEQESERETLLSLGVELAQGFLFHREEARA